MFRFRNIPHLWKRIIAYGLVAIASSAVTLCICLGKNIVLRYTGNGDAVGNAEKLNQIYEIIRNNYIGEFDEEELIDKAAASMVAGIGDKWSYYMTSEKYKQYLEDTKNVYVGIGVVIDMADTSKGFLVQKVQSDSGAYAVGMQEGDIITHVEGECVVGTSHSKVKEMIRGKDGTSVALTINRGGQTLTLQVPRGAVEVKVAQGEMLENDIGLVTIYNFDDRCMKETVAAIEALKAQGAKGLIFDVRNNPGGYVTELVALLDYLLPEGVLFRSENIDGTKEEKTSDKNCLEMPMAVLVNEKSYSAAEFFAAALAEYDWAVTVGQHTTGKGYFQTNFKLPDGSAVHLSIGRYFTPKGVNLTEKGGITPAVEVKVGEDIAKKIAAGTSEPKDDPQIQEAVKSLLMEIN